MSERRLFSRLKTKIPASITLKNGDRLTGQVNDISEEGINVSIPGTELSKITAKDNLIKINFADYLDKKETDQVVLTIQATVLRADIGLGNVRLGCSVQDEQYRQYVVAKKKTKLFVL